MPHRFSLHPLLFLLAGALPMTAQTLYVPGGTNGLGSSSNGNVGIGRTTPSAPLDVNGTIQLVRTANNTRTFQFSLENGAADIIWPSGAGFPLRFGTGSVGSFVELMRVTDGGNVGIGTTSPGAKLDVVGGISIDDASTFALRRSQGTGVYAIHYANVGPHYPMRFVGSSDSTTHRYFEFGYYTGENQVNTWNANVVIDSYSGNVGIGTTNPMQKLSVNGTIRAKEVIVDTGWSDFVFDAGYKLKALSETEAYIQAEHHLPGIPSAQEVAEHGVSMGEMQSKLLAKIEELTLHQIALEKENRALRERVTALEHR